MDATILFHNRPIFMLVYGASSASVLLHVCVHTASISCPASWLITEIFGFSLQQAARFQPVRACHLSPHSPLWPRTQLPIWGDSSSLLSHTHEQARCLLFRCTGAYPVDFKHTSKTVDLSGLHIKINNILHVFGLDFVSFILFTIVCNCMLFGFHLQHLGAPGAHSREGCSST